MKTHQAKKPEESTHQMAAANRVGQTSKNEGISLEDNRASSTMQQKKVDTIQSNIPIQKKNDNHYFENYRPISILPSVSKMLKIIVHNQIYQYLTASKLFYTSQYGFHKSHSTELATFELLDRIFQDMERNKLPINIYMDR